MSTIVLIVALVAVSIDLKAAPHRASAQSADEWSFVASLRLGRDLHTASLLPDGRVLVTGGRANGVGVTDTTEIFDPGTYTWTDGPSLLVPRYGHSAVVLLSGDVLVFGGDNFSVPPLAAEKYDPLNNQWTSAGSMSTARRLHTATRLSDGRVLVAGGYGGGFVSSAEIYDPSTNVWTQTGSLNFARALHSAARLSDGRVLVTGGEGSSGYLVASEIYDPVTGSWTTTGSTSRFRTSHASLGLSGGSALIAGGPPNTEVYSGTTQSWADSTVIEERYGHASAVLSDGDLVISGGIRAPSELLFSADRFDVQTNVWTAIAPMNVARETHTITELPDGRLLAVGGFNHRRALRSAEILGPPGSVPPVPTPTPGDAPLAYTLGAPNAQTSGGWGTTFALADVDGDGRKDVIAGDPGQAQSGPINNLATGRVHVFSGATGALMRSLQAPSPQSYAAFGASVAGGDIDLDGHADIIVGEPFRDNYEGRVHVFSGATGGLLFSVASHLPSLSQHNFGRFVESADVDGDGAYDIIVSSPNELVNGSQHGRVYVYSGLTRTLLYTIVNPTSGFGPSFGYALGVGDATGDAKADIVIGVLESASGNENQGRAYLFAGDDGALIRTFEAPNPQTSAYFGNSVAIGDVDGNGLGDVVVGAPYVTVGSTEFQGRAYVLSSSTGAVIRTYDKPSPPGTASFGYAVHSEDVDGDSAADVLVGAYHDSINGEELEGSAYLFSGASSQLLATLVSPSPNWYAEFGAWVRLGDVSGDGYPDAAIGEPGGADGYGRIHVFSELSSPIGPPATATPTRTHTSSPTITPTSVGTPTPTTPPFTAFSIDAIPGGAIDVVRSVPVGSKFSVDVIVDHSGFGWIGYQVVLQYTEPLAALADGLPDDWADPPVQDVTGGNTYAFPFPFGCGPTPPTVLVDLAVPVFCFAEDFVSTSSGEGLLVQIVFECLTDGVATLEYRPVDTYLDDGSFATHGDVFTGATIICGVPVSTSTHTPTVTSTFTTTNTPLATSSFTHTPTPPGTPTQTPFAGTPPAISKSPEGNDNNTDAAGDLPLANLFLCEDTDGNGPICSGPNEGKLTFTERAFSPEVLAAFEFQIKFDHKIFDINLECVTEQDPGPACTGDQDEDFTLNTDADTWDIQLSQQLKGDFGREWGMDLCVRNVTENYINFACVSTGPPDSGGLSGDIALADVTLHPDPDLKFRLRPGNDNGVVRVILDENCELVDTLGHPQPGSVAGGLTSVCGDLAVTVRILEGDLDLDCDVDLADAQAIAARYGMVFGLFLYDPWYDLEPNITDFDIDAKDLQKVFGRLGSTCQDPIPPQPPGAPPQA